MVARLVEGCRSHGSESFGGAGRETNRAAKNHRARLGLDGQVGGALGEAAEDHGTGAEAVELLHRGRGLAGHGDEGDGPVGVTGEDEVGDVLNDDAEEIAVGGSCLGGGRIGRPLDGPKAEAGGCPVVAMGLDVRDALGEQEVEIGGREEGRPREAGGVELEHLHDAAEPAAGSNDILAGHIHEQQRGFMSLDIRAAEGRHQPPL